MFYHAKDADTLYIPFSIVKDADQEEMVAGMGMVPGMHFNWRSGSKWFQGSMVGGDLGKFPKVKGIDTSEMVVE